MYNKFPLYIPIKVDKNKYIGLAMRLIEPLESGKTDIEFLSVYYNEDERGANPYALTASDSFLFRDDYMKGIEIFKACIGHYAYTKARLEQYDYYIEDRYIGVKRKDLKIDSLIKKLEGRATIITKHDKLNTYLDGLEKGVAYNRIEQKNMAQLIYRRFNIGINNDAKLLKRPNYYLNKAMKYTDYKLAPVSSSKEYNSASDYFGIRLIIPKSSTERISYFEDIENTFKNIVNDTAL